MKGNTDMSFYLGNRYFIIFIGERFIFPPEPTEM